MAPIPVSDTVSQTPNVPKLPSSDGLVSARAHMMDVTTSDDTLKTDAKDCVPTRSLIHIDDLSPVQLCDLVIEECGN